MSDTLLISDQPVVTDEFLNNILQNDSCEYSKLVGVNDDEFDVIREASLQRKSAVIYWKKCLKSFPAKADLYLAINIDQPERYDEQFFYKVNGHRMFSITDKFYFKNPYRCVSAPCEQRSIATRKNIPVTQFYVKCVMFLNQEIKNSMLYESSESKLVYTDGKLGQFFIQDGCHINWFMKSWNN